MALRAGASLSAIDVERTFGCYDASMGQTLGSWQQVGRVSLWRYRKAPKMYAGWHFSADKNGCGSLLELFDILSGATSPAYRTLMITDPATAGVDRIFGGHDLRLDVPAKLRFGNDLDGNGRVGLSDDVFVMPLGSVDISNLSEAARDVSAGNADFGLSFDTSDIILRFWWWPKER